MWSHNHPVLGFIHIVVDMTMSSAGCKIIEGIEANCLEAPTSCLDALEFSLLFCYSLTCSCLLKLTCPLKITLKCLPFKILILHPGQVGAVWVSRDANFTIWSHFLSWAPKKGGFVTFSVIFLLSFLDKVVLQAWQIGKFRLIWKPIYSSKSTTLKKIKNVQQLITGAN